MCATRGRNIQVDLAKVGRLHVPQAHGALEGSALASCYGDRMPEPGVPLEGLQADLKAFLRLVVHQLRLLFGEPCHREQGAVDDGSVLAVAANQLGALEDVVLLGFVQLRLRGLWRLKAYDKAVWAPPSVGGHGCCLALCVNLAAPVVAQAEVPVHTTGLCRKAGNGLDDRHFELHMPGAPEPLAEVVVGASAVARQLEERAVAPELEQPRVHQGICRHRPPAPGRLHRLELQAVPEARDLAARQVEVLQASGELQGHHADFVQQHPALEGAVEHVPVAEGVNGHRAGPQVARGHVAEGDLLDLVARSSQVCFQALEQMRLAIAWGSFEKSAALAFHHVRAHRGRVEVVWAVHWLWQNLPLQLGQVRPVAILNG